MQNKRQKCNGPETIATHSQQSVTQTGIWTGSWFGNWSFLQWLLEFLLEHQMYREVNAVLRTCKNNVTPKHIRYLQKYFIPVIPRYFPEFKTTMNTFAGLKHGGVCYVKNGKCVSEWYIHGKLRRSYEDIIPCDTPRTDIVIRDLDVLCAYFMWHEAVKTHNVRPYKTRVFDIKPPMIL